MKPNRFRFRAWHPATKFIYVDTGLSSLGINDAIRVALMNGYVLMQSTGLADRNGKEIFEGDIVNITSMLGDVFICPVYWDNKLSCFDIKRGDMRENRGMVVIGNIYENKELLK